MSVLPGLLPAHVSALSAVAALAALPMNQAAPPPAAPGFGSGSTANVPPSPEIIGTEIPSVVFFPNSQERKVSAQICWFKQPQL